MKKPNQIAGRGERRSGVLPTGDRLWDAGRQSPYVTGKLLRVIAPRRDAHIERPPKFRSVFHRECRRVHLADEEPVFNN